MEQVIFDILKEIDPYEEFDENTNLLDEEILDSLGIMILIERLEERYEIHIELEKLEKEYFTSIGNIVEFVNRIITKESR